MIDGRFFYFLLTRRTVTVDGKRVDEMVLAEVFTSEQAGCAAIHQHAVYVPDTVAILMRWSVLTGGECHRVYNANKNGITKNLKRLIVHDSVTEATLKGIEIAIAIMQERYGPRAPDSVKPSPYMENVNRG